MTTRRNLLTAFGTTGLVAALPQEAEAAGRAHAIVPRRTLGRTGFTAVPLGLGGQAALQWTPPGTDPADIVVRAVELGVNYLDTSNVYGDSQLHYGEAFRRLRLAPGRPGYDGALRGRLFVASKTTQRFGNDRAGPAGRTAVEDLKRSLTQIFGDGNGAVPEGAYLDSMQLHAFSRPEDVDEAFAGLKERGGRMPEKIGALAALLDYRDGTDYTGLNPDHRRCLGHVGISGHSSPVLMEALRRDEGNDLDTLLVPLNVADKLYLPFQTNVLPLAVARGMGVIAMKVFADGAFMGKPSRWSRGPGDVVTTVGDPAGRIDYREMIRYTLSLPGVCCAIIGIGHIDRRNPARDQLVANFAAAIDAPMTAQERESMERRVAASYGATTNYFQPPARGLVQPTEVTATPQDGRVVVRWQAGLAGADPIRAYHIRVGSRTVLTIPARQQLTKAPLAAYLTPQEAAGGAVTVIASETL